jgi:hypothetical protein
MEEYSLIFAFDYAAEQEKGEISRLLAIITSVWV